MPPLETAAFVLCIEDNELRDQALLLIASIRAFAGRFANSEIFAVAPRAYLGVDATTRRRLAAAQVVYHEEVLNTLCPWYASANRLFAAAWAAAHCSADVLFVLDSDTLVLGEPELPGDGIDLAARPIDVKGCATSGDDDHCEPYWRSFCALAGMPVGGLPWVETTIDHQVVRASYNGGYSAIRRRSRIAEHAAGLYARSLAAGLLPTAGNPGHVVASTGPISPLASRYWGSNQAATAIAAWSTTRSVRLLDRRTNVPLHCLAEPTNWHDDWSDIRPLHVHYHWMLQRQHRARGFELLARLGISREQLAWIEAQTSAPPSPRLAPRAPVAARPAGGATVSRQVIVCGMHRSATSLVAHVLQLAGVDVGRELNPAGIGNPRGHFEDLEVFRLHEAMLAAAGHTSLSADRPPAEPGSSFEEHARRLIARRATQKLWGFKDPRTCLFLDFWERLLPAPVYVMLYRHPVDVVLSLWRRGSDPELWQDPRQALRSWELHNLALLDFHSRHLERCYLAHAPTVTADLPGLVRRLGEKFRLDLRTDGVADVLAPGELTPPQGGSALPWQEIIGDALEIYARLERTADWPARGAPDDAVSNLGKPSPDRQQRRLSETLLYALLGGTSPAPLPLRAGSRAARRDGRETSGRAAELERELATMAADRAGIAAHRDALARTLTAIETSRAFRLVHAWWALRQRLGRAKARPPGAL